jgi:hypothetical protein
VDGGLICPVPYPVIVNPVIVSDRSAVLVDGGLIVLPLIKSTAYTENMILARLKSLILWSVT